MPKKTTNKQTLENYRKDSWKNVVKNENIEEPENVEKNTEKPKKPENNFKKEYVFDANQLCGPACASFIVATIIVVIL
jgi:hypothetical protein